MNLSDVNFRKTERITLMNKLINSHDERASRNECMWSQISGNSGSRDINICAHDENILLKNWLKFNVYLNGYNFIIFP